MKMNRVTSWMFLLAAVSMVTLPVHALAKEYKLGLSLAITGPTSDAGNPYSKGVEDYFQFVNDTKMLGEDTINCTIRDDQYNNDITKRNFEDFLDQGIVFYLNYSTGSTLALKKDFEEEKMPVIPASFHAGNLVDSNYIFLPIASYSAQAIGLAEYVVKNHKEGTPKVAMFIHPSAFGRGPVEDLQKAVGAGLKMEIVEVVEHGKDLDNTAMLQRLVSKGVQYVISQTVQSPVATMLKDASSGLLMDWSSVRSELDWPAVPAMLLILRRWQKQRAAYLKSRSSLYPLLSGMLRKSDKQHILPFY